MARCPYAPHRLVTQRGVCRRCSGDVGLYAAVQSLPVGLYNQARRLAGQREFEAAAALLAETLRLRPDFAEALWLFAAVEAGRGRDDEARARLEEASRAGARVDLMWGQPKVPDPPVAPVPVIPEAASEFPALELPIPVDDPLPVGGQTGPLAEVAAPPTDLQPGASPAKNPQTAPVGAGLRAAVSEALALFTKKPSGGDISETEGDPDK